MSVKKIYGSPVLAKKAREIYGDRVKTFTVKIKHEKAVREFIRKIEDAHKEPADTDMVFGAQG